MAPENFRTVVDRRRPGFRDLQLPPRAPCRHPSRDQAQPVHDAVLLAADPLAEPPAVDRPAFARNAQQGLAELGVDELRPAVELRALFRGRAR